MAQGFNLKIINKSGLELQLTLLVNDTSKTLEYRCMNYWERFHGKILKDGHCHAGYVETKSTGIKCRVVVSSEMNIKIWDRNYVHENSVFQPAREKGSIWLNKKRFTSWQADAWSSWFNHEYSPNLYICPYQYYEATGGNPVNPGLTVVVMRLEGNEWPDNIPAGERLITFDMIPELKGKPYDWNG